MRTSIHKFALPDNLIQLSNKDWSAKIEHGVWAKRLCLLQVRQIAVTKESFQNAVSLLETILPPDHPKLAKHYEEIKNIEEDHND